MIVVTKLNDASCAINADMIERINADPDTTLTMIGGVRYVVRESMAEIIDKITDYRADVLSRAYHRPCASAVPAERN